MVKHMSDTEGNAGEETSPYEERRRGIEGEKNDIKFFLPQLEEKKDFRQCIALLPENHRFVSIQDKLSPEGIPRND
jgi:hypothetical protein